MYRNQQVVARIFTKGPSDYYKILWDNDLVPIDIRKPTILKDYAKILRSFSRSGELDKNPENLESFLFGSERKESIWKKYEQLLASVGRDKRDYERNSHRIHRIERRMSGFRQLDNLLKEVHLWRRDYQENELYIAQKNRKAAQVEIERFLLQTQSTQLSTFRLGEAQAHRNLNGAWAKLISYRSHQRRLQELPDLIDKANEDLQTAETLKKAAEETARFSRENLVKANKVETWLSFVGPDYKDLYTALETKQTEERHAKLRNDLWAYLNQQKQTDILRFLGWDKGFSALQIQQECNEWEQTAIDARRLASYTDLANPKSLTSWALKRSDPLTLDQESVLAHFGQFDKWKNKEERQARFLETADLLIHDKMVIENGVSTAGFWLCLAGTKEWIVRLSPEQRLFEHHDKEQVRKLLETWNQKNEKQAEILEDKSQKAKALLEVLEGCSYWEEALPLLNNTKTNKIIIPIDFPTSSSDIGIAVDLHRKRSYLIAEQESKITNENQANINYGHTFETQLTLRSEQGALQKQIDEVDRGQLASDLWKYRIQLRSIQQEANNWLSENSANIPIELIRKHHAETGAVDSLSNDELTKQLIQAEINLENGQKQLIETENKLAELQRIEQEVQLNFEKLPLVEADKLDIIPTYSDVQEKENDYELLFRELVKEFLSSDEISKYRPAEDLLHFMQEVLPDEVRGAMIRSTDEGQERLQSAWNSINESMREIARLKLVELGQLIGDVREAYDDFAKDIGDLQKYFRREKTEITGGFRPYVAIRSVTAYPVEWLDEFQRTAADPETVRQLANLDSLESILYRAYDQKGGTDPKRNIPKLLDPLSYVKLEFEMKNEEGYVNDGSSGQTFMAAALLNIARLSVIGRTGGPNTALRGLRFMAIDEVDSLGSNYQTLLELAHKENFQVISLSVRPLVYEAGSQQRLYFLHLGRNKTLRQNLPPVMLSKGELTPVSTERFTPPSNPTLFDPLPPDVTA
ncbi:DNA double-strand break repair rad50 ATPase [Fibrisoma limi BUZ 3]|uniref:DNA double-strand break repair rad50 ATPase n=2 Tax=Fibrisoma limi TaxID=663275 RepID=I2GN83_9BACT|nr:DNA double-strand break repair rad50 ATPase [Fibrisoma limi BUZ 3]